MMIATWGSTLVLLTAQVETDVQVGATLLQTAGTIPNVAVDPGTNQTRIVSRISYDTQLTPQVKFQAASSRWLLNLGYEPRFLLRVQEVDEGAATSFSALETEDGRPFLVRHEVGSLVKYLINPRWTWTLNGRFVAGEQDYQTVANNGLGVASGAIGGGDSGGGSSSVPPASASTGGGTVQRPVISSTAFSIDSGLDTPLWGRHQLNMGVAWRLTLNPEDSAVVQGGSGSVGDQQNDVLCLLDRDEAQAQQGVVFANTCQIEARLGVTLDYSVLDTIRLTSYYSAVDFDPGPFSHLGRLDGVWRHSWSRTGSWRLGLGVIYAVQQSNNEVDPGSNQVSSPSDTSIIPVVIAGAQWALIQRRLFNLFMDISTTIDGFADPVLQEYYSQASLTVSFRSEVGRNFQGSLILQGATVAIERSSAPSDALGVERADLSTLSAGLRLGWKLNEQFQVLGNANFFARGPHRSQFGNAGLSQEQATISLGLVWVYGTRNNQVFGRQPTAQN